MLWRNTPEQWGVVAKTFHWVTFLLLCGMVFIGFYMKSLGPEAGDLRAILYPLHKSFGLTILMLTALRLAWRQISHAPTLPPMALWERALARGVQALLYVVILALPLTGWLMGSSHERHISTSFFGLFQMPHLVDPNPALFQITKEGHEVLVYTLLTLVGLHVAGALRHHFVKKDSVLRRMLP